MTKAANKSEASEDDYGNLYPIRTVADLTGVNAITLRAWERRYDLIQPRRTPSGHRLYSEQDIHLINTIVGLLHKGISIGQVQSHLRGQISIAKEQDLLPQEPWSTYLQRMLSAVIRFDEKALDEAYNESLSLYSVTMVTHKLLLPLLYQLGQRWQSAEGSVAEEHFFAVYLRNKLGARFHHRIESGDGPKLMLSCLPGEQHEIGLLLFALEACQHGFRIIMLGANMPIEELPAAAKRAACDAIVLSASIKPSAEMLHKQLSALSQNSAVPIFLGGPTSISCRDDIVRAGIMPLGIELEKAIELINTSLKHA